MKPVDLTKALSRPLRTVIAGAPEGLDALILSELARAAHPKPILHLARDDQRLAILADALAFFAPDIEVLEFPAWDCLPYDRVSPAPRLVAARLATLARLLNDAPSRPRLVISTVNAAVQRVPPMATIAAATFKARPGNRVPMEEFLAFLQESGFARSGTVVDPGEFAVRGGIVDLYPPGAEQPVRLDFFGDILESIRTFDPDSQRSTGQLHGLTIDPANEVMLNEATVARFRTGYAAAFPGTSLADPLYEAVSAGRRYPGMEHWLPLFYESLASLFDYLPEAPLSFDQLTEEALTSRRAEIEEYYNARIEARTRENFGAPPYNPLPPERLYLAAEDIADSLQSRPLFQLTPFEVPQTAATPVMSVGGRQGRSFAAERAEAGRNVYQAVKLHTEALRKAGKRVLIAAWSEGARDRLETILRDHEVTPLAAVRDFAEARAAAPDVVCLVVLGLEHGFETEDFAIIGEQDILGDRLVRRARRHRKATDFIAELQSLTPGDLVVHVEHGIGRFEGLKVIDVQGAPHDCLHLSYAGGDRLFLPVENLELISRFGSDEAGVQLDRLGSGAWQARKAKLKERVREIADELIRTAAARQLRPGEVLPPPDGLYDEFCARFPYEETEDQLAAIQAVLEDLQSGRPMDRLICGDVGFGKTEVALRTAFVAAMAGKQVAVVVPTTLLARQHYATFSERFRDLPIKIAHASRLTPRKELAETKAGLASGDVDIVVGTHALLAGGIKFRALGVLVIDEEQHFGVKHKERLKELRANVHVLTLTATPIPRTLQLALSGVRELSLITTPPLDRLAVRTFISPFDPVIIREHLLRELYRGGQSFFVVPRIADLKEMTEFLATQVPEAKFAVAHGRLAATELDDVMTAFYERKYDVLLATTIIESGLDIPSANTLIVHRSDMFGLAQLYQLRGRVGRSKQRAYALLTVPPNKPLTTAAEKRLKVLQSLDSLGAGFSLASHDLDIRGAGNLLGEEQSGHIKEVGFELYQSMLEEAVASLRSGDKEVLEEGGWSPQINIGTAVLIPEGFIPDLQVRLGIYRRLADVASQADLDGFAAELADRFGRLPAEVRHLLEVVAIKLMCRAANVASIDAGPKGALIGLRDGRFANPEALVQWITAQGSRGKLRPDMKIVIMRDWETAEQRLKGARQIMGDLVKLATV
jgi:transcription-repair coupling factor (superfamily II helicase)